MIDLYFHAQGWGRRRLRRLSRCAKGNGKFTTAHMPRPKNFSPDSASLMCRIWTPRLNGSPAIPPPATPRSRSVHCWDRISQSEPTNLHDE